MAKGPVGFGHRLHGGVDVDCRDARLLLDAVHIVGNRLFRIAQVDDELRLGVDQGFHVEVCLVAIELAEGRQVPHILREIGHLVCAGAAGQADEQLRRDGHQDHLGSRAAGAVGKLGRFDAFQRVIGLAAVAPGKQAEKQSAAERYAEESCPGHN